MGVCEQGIETCPELAAIDQAQLTTLLSLMAGPEEWGPLCSRFALPTWRWEGG